MLTAGRECAVAFKALLELIHQVVLKPTYDKKQKLPAFSKEVATCVGEVVQAAEVLKGGYVIQDCVSYLNVKASRVCLLLPHVHYLHVTITSPWQDVYFHKASQLLC